MEKASGAERVSAGALLPNFIWDERERYDSRELNVLLTYAQQVAELVGYLEVTAEDYEAASRAFLDASERQHKLTEEINERLGTSDHEVTAEERELLDAQGLASLRVFLRIETFYVFAKILLDRLAAFIPYYFGPAHDVRLSRHSKVEEALPRFAEQKGLTLAPSLTERVAELTRRVSDYRDKRITHDHSPRTSRGTAYDLGTGEAMIYTYRMYPARPEDASFRSETPRTLLPLIEGYVGEIVALVETNSDKAERAAQPRPG
jgi:hypothetical protein